MKRLLLLLFIPLFSYGQVYFPGSYIGGATRPKILSISMITQKVNIQGDGNSLMAGFLSSVPATKNPIAVLKTTLPTSQYEGFTNVAVSGQTVTQMIPRQSTFLFPNKIAKDLNIVIMGDGINDLISSAFSAASTYNNIKTYFANCIAQGYKCIVLTTSACQKIYGIGVDFGENSRQELDRLIRAGWKTDLGCSALVDVGSDGNLGVFNPAFNTTYFNADGQHLTDFGYAYKAGLIQPAVQAVAAGNTYGAVTTQLASPLPIFTTTTPASTGITWPAVSGANNYVVLKNTVNRYSDATQIYSGSALTCNDTGLSASTTYYYFVKAQGSAVADSRYYFLHYSTPTAGTSQLTPATGNLRQFAADLGVVAGTSWADQSGSGDVATPVTTGKFPTVIAGQLNGKQVLQFKSTQLQGSINVGITGNQPRTFMCVARVLSQNNLQYPLFGGIFGLGDQVYTNSNAAGNSGKICDLVYAANNNIGMNVLNSYVYGPTFTYLPPWMLITIVFDGTNAIVTQNGASGSSTATSTAALVDGKLRLGGSHLNTLDASLIEIAEIIIRNDTDATALTTNTNYLKTKWGL